MMGKAGKAPEQSLPTWRGARGSLEGSGVPTKQGQDIHPRKTKSVGHKRTP